MMSSTDKIPPKSILKRPRSSISADSHILWDEENLEKNENERVPRMKINEAKTPFHQLSPNHKALLADDSEDMPTIDNIMSLSSMTLPQRDDDEDDNDDEYIDDEEDEDKFIGLSGPELEAARLKEEKFASMRKAHYNMKAALMTKKFDESDDESDRDISYDSD